MAGRRYFQRGHASVSASYPGSGHGGSLRWAVGAGSLAAIAAVSWLISSFMGHESTSVTSAAIESSPALADPPVQAPSLLNSALAKIQGNPARASGLMSVDFSEDTLKRTEPFMGKAEARLLGIYELVRQARHREALAQAEALTRDHPNFQLAQLVLGDLLTLQTRPIRTLGDVPDTKALAAEQQLGVLREQSRRRLLALTERPPEGAVPTQFLSLSSQSRHAIAVDASRSRLYLFENVSVAPGVDGSDKSQSPARLKLVGDYYISVGQSGIDKLLEGDLRTPVGVYYITSSLDPSRLPDLYGSGALPINYPNALDVQRGKTGSGIWLHGSPSEQFARPPQASEGCVVLSNPDFESVLARVETRTTPVVIANELNWVDPSALDQDRRRFQASLEAWRQSKSKGNLDQLRTHYSDQFNNQGQSLNDWWPRVTSEVKAQGAREVQLKELSMLNWRDKDDTMVVTFGEVAQGQTRGLTKRQYWIREEDQWKIFYEGPV